MSDAIRALECAECGRESREVRDRLRAENAKLRELVAAYQEVADFPICKLYDERKPDPFSGACAECDGEGCLIQCLNDELRELGVEVE